MEQSQLKTFASRLLWWLRKPARYAHRNGLVFSVPVFLLFQAIWAKA